MTPSSMVLGIILTIAIVGTLIGVRAGAGRKRSLEEWSVAGRSFGVIFVWLLMAGEIYTTFALLGTGGWVYSRGGPALYILAYITLGYVVSFYVLPYVWEIAQRHGLQTQSDFFAWRYRSKFLAMVVSIAGILFVIPYLQLQLTGLSIIVQVASFDAISRNVSMMVAIALIAFFVFVGGMRAIAWVSILKDSLMLLAAISIGVYVPFHFFGGPGPMFHQLAATHAEHLTMPGSTKIMGHSWFITTVLLSAFGFYMWPHIFSASLAAKSGETLRRNAVVTPLYTLSLLFIFWAAFASILLLPGLKNPDMSILLLARKSFPVWFLGIIGGAGALTAMVPSAIILLTASTVAAKNVFQPLVSKEMSERQLATLARAMVVLLSLVSLFCALHSSATLVALLLLGYAGVTQFFPGVVLGLFWPNATGVGITSGLLAGISIAGWLMLTKNDPFHGINAGFLALCINMTISVLVSWITSSTKTPMLSASLIE